LRRATDPCRAQAETLYSDQSRSPAEKAGLFFFIGSRQDTLPRDLGVFYPYWGIIPQSYLAAGLDFSGSFDASGAEILRCCSAADHRSLGRRAKSLLDLYLIPLDFRAGLALKSATPG
jgi:hypothetical protein